MANRKLPFGYSMQQGQIIPAETEAALVPQIFEAYLQGSSLREIADALNAQPVPYLENRRWNKNILARLLADERYTGAKSCPPLIDRAVFCRAAEQSRTKPCPQRKTPLQKVIQRLSGSVPTPQTEQTVLRLLQRLQESPELVQTPPHAPPEDTPVRLLQCQLEEQLQTQPPNEELVQALIFRIAAARYDCADSGDYETLRIRWLLRQPESAPDALCAECVKRILLSPAGAALVLKNDQIIGGEPDETR